MIRLFRVAPNVYTLGPGKRFCIWVQGCMHHCKDCMSKETWSLEGGYLVDEDELVSKILAYEFEGITVSGGEPMLQCKELLHVILGIKDKRDVGVILYTGMTMDEIKAKGSRDMISLLQVIDLLIDGVYISDLDDGGALRGSSNQKAWFLSERYRSAVEPIFGVSDMREQQLQIDDRGALLIGLRSPNGISGFVG